MVALRSMRNVSGLVAARMRITAIASASTMAMMIKTSDMAGSVWFGELFGHDLFRKPVSTFRDHAVAAKSAAERQQRAQEAVAQPQPGPQHQAEIEPEQRVREQRAIDPDVRCDGATEIAGEQDRTEDRRRRHRIEQGADDGDEAKAARKTIACTVAHLVHR